MSRDLEVMSGALCFKGTSVPVQNLFDYLERNTSLEEFLQGFPSMSRETAVAVIEDAKGQAVRRCDCFLTSLFWKPSNEFVALLPLVHNLEQALGRLLPYTFVRVEA